MFSAAFVKVEPLSLKNLKLVENYITYGFLAKRTISELIQKRGFLKGEENKRLIINSNTVVEDILGEQGCICI